MPSRFSFPDQSKNFKQELLGAVSVRGADMPSLLERRPEQTAYERIDFIMMESSKGAVQLVRAAQSQVANAADRVREDLDFSYAGRRQTQIDRLLDSWEKRFEEKLKEAERQIREIITKMAV